MTLLKMIMVLLVGFGVGWASAWAQDADQGAPERNEAVIVPPRDCSGTECNTESGAYQDDRTVPLHDQQMVEDISGSTNASPATDTGVPAAIPDGN